MRNVSWSMHTMATVSFPELAAAAREGGGKATLSLGGKSFPSPRLPPLSHAVIAQQSSCYDLRRLCVSR